LGHQQARSARFKAAAGRSVGEAETTKLPSVMSPYMFLDRLRIRDYNRPSGSRRGSRLSETIAAGWLKLERRTHYE
jgi:hypothetical protein